MGQIIGLILVGRGCKKGGEFPGRIRAINPACYPYPVAHCDEDGFFDFQAIALFLRSSRFLRHRLSPYLYQASVLVSVPTPSSSTSTVSPAFMNTGGLRPMPTPAGEPVVTKSPGLNRYHFE